MDINTPYYPTKHAYVLFLGVFIFEQKKIVFRDQKSVTYEKCLLAMAGEPRSFYVLDGSAISNKFKDKYISSC